jgi:hypothetical protein
VPEFWFASVWAGHARFLVHRHHAIRPLESDRIGLNRAALQSDA